MPVRPFVRSSIRSSIPSVVLVYYSHIHPGPPLSTLITPRDQSRTFQRPDFRPAIFQFFFQITMNKYKYITPTKILNAETKTKRINQIISFKLEIKLVNAINDCILQTFLIIINFLSYIGKCAFI